MTRVVVIGGYGGFGGLLSRRLAQSGLDVIVAGRRIAAAEAFCRDVPGCRAAYADREDGAGALLAAERPRLVIDASGPFQAASYALVEQCIGRGASYLDLADARDFVAGISRYDSAAKMAGVTVISGASSVPALSGAVVRELADALDSIAAVEIAISASSTASAGRSVAAAILRGVGRPFPVWRSQRQTTAYGWQGTRSESFAAPGARPLNGRLVSLADVPDVELLPPRLPGRPSVTFRAGTESKLEVLGLWLASWLTRWGWLRSLDGFSSPLIAAHGLISRFGGDRSGMVVRLFGVAAGRRLERRWSLVADAGDGPKIPTLAAFILADRIIARRIECGAGDAGALLALADFAPEFAKLAVNHGISEFDQPKSLYRRVLGPRFGALPASIRAMHDVLRDGGAHGRAQVQRGASPVARLIAWVMRFPPAGEYPLHVQFAEREGVETWTRDFGGHRFRSKLYAAGERLAERFGPLRFLFDLEADGAGLRMRIAAWSMFGLPLPLALAPRSAAREWEDDGRFRFQVPIALPLIGPVVHYEGWLQPGAAAS